MTEKPSQTSTSGNMEFDTSSVTINFGNLANRKTKLCEGPRRVACFCVLAVFMPSMFVSIVLLTRFVFNGSATYHINPTDMRILDHKISTTWCQSEVIRMNTTFTAYSLHGEPKLIKAPAPLTRTRTLFIPDDQKEYWGFYLLKGSTFRIRTCARHKGGTLLVVKGRSTLHHCAYIGESDSAEDSDELSNSKSEEDDKRKNGQNETKISLRTTPSTSKGTSVEEMSQILSKIRDFVKNRPKNYNKLKENLSQWMQVNGKVEKKVDMNETERSNGGINDPNDPESSLSGDGPHRIRHENSKVRHLIGNLEEAEGFLKGEHGTIHKNRRSIDIRKKTESGENGAFEDKSEIEDENNPLLLALNGSSSHKEIYRRNNITGTSQERNGTVGRVNDTPNSIWKKEHSHHSGIMDDPNPNQANDGSDSESESSYSSSEEALAKCEGVVASLYLKASPNCSVDELDDEDIPIFYESVVNASGYYYFIFGSENEKQVNVIKTRFELEKFVYDLPPALHNCSDVSQCRVNLTFWSDQKLVVEIPQPAPEQEFIWDEVYVAETECEPRVMLYLIFVVIVPLCIVLCAFQ